MFLDNRLFYLVIVSQEKNGEGWFSDSEVLSSICENNDDWISCYMVIHALRCTMLNTERASGSDEIVAACTDLRLMNEKEKRRRTKAIGLIVNRVRQGGYIMCSVKRFHCQTMFLGFSKYRCKNGQKTSGGKLRS